MGTSFAAMDVARTGVGFNSYWLDQIGHNLANLNTRTPTDEEPFRARDVVASPLQGAPFGGGVAVGDVVNQDGEPPAIHDPDHPLADDDGYVNGPVMDLAGQLTDMIVAQRGYEANIRTVESARDAYESALRIGQ